MRNTLCFKHKGEAEAFLTPHEKGERVRVFHDPEEPTFSVLDPTSAGFDYRGLALRYRAPRGSAVACGVAPDARGTGAGPGTPPPSDGDWNDERYSPESSVKSPDIQ